MSHNVGDAWADKDDDDNVDDDEEADDNFGGSCSFLPTLDSSSPPLYFIAPTVLSTNWHKLGFQDSKDDDDDDDGDDDTHL